MSTNHFPLDPAYAHAPAITGIDEAGRGCLAGPVVVASVTWDPRSAATQPWFPGLADSKTLSEANRLSLYPEILAEAIHVRTAVIQPIVIDTINILQATLHGFEMTAPRYQPPIPLLIDGNRKPNSLKHAETVIKGDGRVSAVAAAGIIAKVTRDTIIREIADNYPGYGLEIHKGYATAQHRAAIEALGPCPIHRKSFRPVSTHIPEWSDHDHALLELMDRGDAGDAVTWWRSFMAGYHRHGRLGSLEIIKRFTALGFSILPKPGENYAPDDFDPHHFQAVGLDLNSLPLFS